VLSGVAVTYYKKEGAPKKAGLFHIGGAELMTDGLTLQLQLPHRLFVLRCDDASDLEKWCTAIVSAQTWFAQKGHKLREPRSSIVLAEELAAEPEPELEPEPEPV
jgi:hypothetical protein